MKNYETYINETIFSDTRLRVNGWERRMRQYIADGEINSVNDNGDTPLIMAIANNNFAAIDVLLEYDELDLNQVGGYNQNALILIARKIYNDIMFEKRGIELLFKLLKKDIYWWQKDNDGNFFLDYLDKKTLKKIEELYPEKYKEYLKLEKAKEFNL